MLNKTKAGKRTPTTKKTLGAYIASYSELGEDIMTIPDDAVARSVVMPDSFQQARVSEWVDSLAQDDWGSTDSGVEEKIGVAVAEVDAGVEGKAEVDEEAGADGAARVDETPAQGDRQSPKQGEGPQAGAGIGMNPLRRAETGHGKRRRSSGLGEPSSGQPAWRSDSSVASKRRRSTQTPTPGTQSESLLELHSEIPSSGEAPPIDSMNPLSTIAQRSAAADRSPYLASTSTSRSIASLSLSRRPSSAALSKVHRRGKPPLRGVASLASSRESGEEASDMDDGTVDHPERLVWTPPVIQGGETTSEGRKFYSKQVIQFFCSLTTFRRVHLGIAACRLLRKRDYAGLARLIVDFIASNFPELEWVKEAYVAVDLALWFVTPEGAEQAEKIAKTFHADDQNKYTPAPHPKSGQKNSEFEDARATANKRSHGRFSPR